MSVEIDSRGEGYEKCFEHAEVTDVAPGGYFKLSAKTDEDQDIDDHDIYSFEVYELDPVSTKHTDHPNEKEDIQSGKEFKMREEFNNHPAANEKLLSQHENQEHAAKLQETVMHIIDRLNHNDELFKEERQNLANIRYIIDTEKIEKEHLKQQLGNNVLTPNWRSPLLLKHQLYCLIFQQFSRQNKPGS